jgi:hypothetical protein
VAARRSSTVMSSAFPQRAPGGIAAAACNPVCRVTYRSPNRLVAEILDANVCPRIELPRFTRVNASVGEDASAKGTRPDLERVLPERVDPPRVAWRPLMRSRLVGTEVLSWIPVIRLHRVQHVERLSRIRHLIWASAEKPYGMAAVIPDMKTLFPERFGQLSSRGVPVFGIVASIHLGVARHGAGLRRDGYGDGYVAGKSRGVHGSGTGVLRVRNTGEGTLLGEHLPFVFAGVAFLLGIPVYLAQRARMTEPPRVPEYRP